MQDIITINQVELSVIVYKDLRVVTTELLRSYLAKRRSKHRKTIPITRDALLRVNTTSKLLAES